MTQRENWPEARREARQEVRHDVRHEARRDSDVPGSRRQVFENGNCAMIQPDFHDTDPIFRNGLE